jgi:prevent-host-death family protein
LLEYPDSYIATRGFDMETTMSSRDFNLRTDLAKKAAEHGPVIVTTRGTPTHVLLSYDEYQKLRGEDKPMSAYDAAMLGPDTSEVDDDFRFEDFRDRAAEEEYARKHHEYLEHLFD